MNSRLLGRHAKLDDKGMRLLQDTMTRLDMSARAYDRILKVARTIADLDYSLSAGMTLREAADAPVLTHHLQEALAYRNLDRASWGSTNSTQVPF